MARATRAGGVSFNEDEMADPTPPANLDRVIKRAMLGEIDRPEGSDQASVGMDSLQSSKSASKSSGSETPSPQEPAPTTENPSDQTDEVETDSSVTSTGGAGRKTTPRRSGKTGSTTARSNRARARTVEEDDFDEFE